jgi:hypothetical protein
MATETVFATAASTSEAGRIFYRAAEKAAISVATPD